MDMYFYYVNKDYIEYLKQAEKDFRGFTCVPDVCYQNCNKFVFGAVLSLNDHNYFVPVSSYSKKQQDLILMTDKQDVHKILGSLRFTYMIPVPSECLTKVDINNYKNRVHISKELAFCRRNRDKIKKQAAKTYYRVNNNIDGIIQHACVFNLLEEACEKYGTLVAAE